MSLKISHLLWLCLPFFIVAVKADDYVTLTDKQDRAIECILLDVSSDQKVKIERKGDRRVFEFPIAQLVEKDQAMIHAWFKQRLLDRNSLLTVEYRSKTGDKTKSDTESHKFEKWVEHFEVSIENISDIPLENLRVEYRTYVYNEDTARDKRTQGNYTRHKGSHKIEKIPPREKVSFETKPVQLESSELKDNWYYTNGGKDKAEDEIEAFWIRIYEGDTLIAESSTSSKIEEKFDFDK